MVPAGRGLNETRPQPRRRIGLKALGLNPRPRRTRLLRGRYGLRQPPDELPGEGIQERARVLAKRTLGRQRSEAVYTRPAGDRSRIGLVDTHRPKANQIGDGIGE